MAEQERSLKLWWTVPIGGFALLILIALLFGQEPPPLRQGTSHDASDRGFRAAYLLLEELRYPVFRSRRATEGGVRWLLFPEPARREAPALDGWVRRGGKLLLATESVAFARDLGIVLEKRLADREVACRVHDEELRLTSDEMRVDWHGRPGEAWATAGGEPLVTIYPHGRGEIWLVHRPEFLTNRLLPEADNAVVLCRLAEAMLEGRAGEKIAFDEFFHGLRDRPGVTELLLTPPTLWVTLQGLLLLALLLWRHVPRFGALRPVPPGSRRSKEEFLDAMAFLLQRRGDHADAYRLARDALLREMARDLGLPGDSDPRRIIEEAARYRGLSLERLAWLLDADAPPTGKGAHALVDALRELETLRHEFLKTVPPR